MDFSGETVYVHGPGAGEYQHMFLKRGFKGTNDPDQASIICFTGGADVDPALYGEDNVASYIDKSRDDLDSMMFGLGTSINALQVGVCRGGQFLNVMNGGKMWQDVDHHARNLGHRMRDVNTGETLICSSTHHQMMRPAADAEIIAVARESKRKTAFGDVWLLEDAEAVDARPEELDDIEVLWYEKTRCLCFQPHPEFDGYKQCTDYFFKLIEKALKE